jgi:hypothetical protein
MKRLLQATLLLTLLASCTKQERDPAYGAFMAHLEAMERGYASTNINTAESALLAYRVWLQERLRNDATNSAGYEPSLCRADERLFALYEVQCNTNRAEHFYQEAVEVNRRVLARQRRTPTAISKEEIRTLLDRSEEGKIAWKNALKSPEK